MLESASDLDTVEGAPVVLAIEVPRGLLRAHLQQCHVLRRRAVPGYVERRVTRHVRVCVPQQETHRETRVAIERSKCVPGCLPGPEGPRTGIAIFPALPQRDYNTA